MRALAPTLVVAVVLLAGCAGTSPAAEPGIGPRAPALPEHRSTCEALDRADLTGIATDPAGLSRTARALADAARRAPADLRTDVDALALAYGDAEPPTSDDPTTVAVLGWFNQRCGQSR